MASPAGASLTCATVRDDLKLTIPTTEERSIRRLTFATILVTAVAMLAGPNEASMQVSRVLLVKPSETHPGGLLYLSGTGFQPHVRENITFACPDAQRAFEIKNSSIETIAGPTTDAQGSFDKFPFRFTPIPQVTSAIECSVYASYGNNALGVDIPGNYTVQPETSSLSPCTFHMCGLGVQPSPHRVHAGLYEVISIKGGWGGAEAEVRVGFARLSPPLQPALQHHTLDWGGKARFKFFIPSRVGSYAAPVAAKVTVRVHLGAVAGSSSGQFTVIR